MTGDHPCSVCGSHIAPFGFGPPGARATVEPDKFVWYCGEHRPDRPPFEGDQEVTTEREPQRQPDLFEAPF